MKQKVLRTGNSLAVVIPSVFVHRVGLKGGDEVEVILDIKQSKIVYVFQNTMQLSLDFKKKEM